MKKTILLSALILAAITAEAQQKHKIKIDAKKLIANKIEKMNTTFVQFNVPGYETEKTLGAPELPVKTWLVKGTPSDIQVKFKKNSTTAISGRPSPVQEQDCRCATDKIKTFSYRADLYANQGEAVQVQYLGAFRGQPISQVNVRLADYNQLAQSVELTTDAEVDISANEFSLGRGDFKDYLILAPTHLVEGVNDFVNWKRENGYNVSVEVVASPNNTTAAIQALIKQYYTEKGTDFVIIVGDENAVPMFRVATSGDSKTPSDLKYYTMDGPTDYIPDMLTSRIVATSAAQVTAQLAKSIEFEKRTWENTAGLNKFIGIASNEGANPSDDQYVKAIEAKYQEVLGSTIVHLHQNDAVNSKPAVLNSHFDSGAAWLTYLGHGSGSSWPSMNQSYSTTHINQLNNKSVVKPIIIDVACQNGRLVSSYLGSQFMKVDSLANNSPFGAVAYYGGSVNISWHPPAVMAQGIAFEHLAKKYNHLGEALLAGQLYLASKWTKKEEVIDNMEWYHLQGDPGLNIGF